MTISINTSWHTAAPRPGRKPTIYEALQVKLGRVPTDLEVREDVFRILATPKVKSNKRYAR